MKYTTGNKTVDAIGQLHLEGNIIPHTWFEHIRFDSGKPDLAAIVILSEIVYWYRPIYVKDEVTGQFLKVKKRFKSDLLQRSYDSFTEQFGLTKRQTRDAIVRLENIGLIKRHFRTIEANNTKLSNVLHIELLHQNVISMTFKSDSYNVETSKVLLYSVKPPTVERQTNTEITTENNKKSCKQAFNEDSPEMILTETLIFEIRKNRAEFKEPNKQNWCKEFDLILRVDDRDRHEVYDLIKWVQQDSFWKSNILSPRKLREKYDQLAIQMYEQLKRQNPQVSQTLARPPKPIELNFDAGEDIQ